MHFIEKEKCVGSSLSQRACEPWFGTAPCSLQAAQLVRTSSDKTSAKYSLDSLDMRIFGPSRCGTPPADSTDLLLPRFRYSNASPHFSLPQSKLTFFSFHHSAAIPYSLSLTPNSCLTQTRFPVLSFARLLSASTHYPACMQPPSRL
jgi:hypothetical protein